MTSLVVTQIKHGMKRNKMLTEKDGNILFATLQAQESRIAALEASLREMVAEFEGATETQDQLDAVHKAKALTGGVK
jgi:hypothetical protein